MDVQSIAYFFILVLFIIGYGVIIFEHPLKVNKTGIALLTAVLCWTVYFIYSPHALSADLLHFGHHVSDVAQIIFFIMGAMALVELIDAHKGFNIITDLVKTRNKKSLLCILAAVTFFLSSVLDNLTTTILMISLLRKLVPDRRERLILGCIVVIAANAGGAWSPIGDVTTTMLWINGQITTVPIMKSLFLPSLISLLVPVGVYVYSLKGKFHLANMAAKDTSPEPGAKIVFIVGILGLIFVPIFKALTGLPPFMGILLALSVLWVITDILHLKEDKRQHLTLTQVLTRIDMSAVLFFLGILLTINALQTAGILTDLAHWLGANIQSLSWIATLLGILSAIIDNVPLVAATMGMYPIESYPPDHTLWHMIAYAAGTGGSILIIGSSSGVALMGMEKVDFISYFKVAALPALLGFLAGMGFYLLTV